jgi:hypothetical protein
LSFNLIHSNLTVIDYLCIKSNCLAETKHQNCMKKPLPLQHKFLATSAKSFIVFAFLVLSGIANGLFAQNWDEAVKAVASDRAAFDLFGYSVSISGDYAIVGAKQEDHNATGGQFLDNAGAAYILKNDSGKWTVVQKLVAPDRAEDDEFGASVAICGDYAIVGAPRKTVKVGFDMQAYAGAAYIFRNTSGTWKTLGKLLAEEPKFGDEFGYSVAISENYAIVGAPNDDVSTNGGVPQSNQGSAQIYKRDSINWSFDQTITGGFGGNGNRFGWSVGISGDYAIVGEPLNGTTAPVNYGKAGAAYIFFRGSLGTWKQSQFLNASDKAAGDEFGNSVAISGDYAIVGAMLEDHNASGGSNLSKAGSAYIFKRNGSTWTQAKKIVASDREAGDMFGVSVSISGDYAIVGAYNEDQDKTGGNTLSNAGSAYIFKNTAGSWAQANKIVASDRGGSDLFGYSVAISGDYAIAGAYSESEDEAGGNNLAAAGSCYIFKNCIARKTDVQTACRAFTWIDGKTYTQSNNTATYNIAGGAASGCDSLVTLNLTINGVANLSTTTSGTKITANNTSATYRWLDCNKNYALIAGQTGASFTPSVNGNYAVELTEKGCVDTSACVAISAVGIIENSFGDNIVVYPNPTNGYFTIDLGNIFGKSEIKIKDILGNLIESATVINSQKLNLFINQPAGIYIVSVEADNKKAVIRILKN